MISRILSNRLFFFSVMLLNLLGAAYGFLFFYWNQLLSTNPLLWIFVPDCPLASLLFAVSLILLYFKKRLDWFYFLTAATAFKYGFWTVFVLSAFPSYYLSFQTIFLYATLFIAHIGLMVEPVALIGRIKFRKWFLFPTALFLFSNELSDYFLATHPPLPGNSLGLMLPLTLLMGLAAIVFAAALVKKRTAPVIEAPFF